LGRKRGVRLGKGLKKKNEKSVRPEETPYETHCPNRSKVTRDHKQRKEKSFEMS